VVPVENSTEGVVARSLDLFLHTPLFIIGETSLFVRHNLLRKIDSLAGMTAVVAHPQALAQCHAWLSTTCRRPSAARCPATPKAPPGIAGPNAGGHRQQRAAGSEFGLHVVAPAIQDDPTTARASPSSPHPQRHPAPKPVGHDCTSLVVSVTNRPGAVHDMLVPLKKHGVSMTRFESRPARSGQWEYYFYIDIEGHPDEPHRGRRAAGTAQRLRLLQGAGHLPRRRALSQAHVQPARCHRLRPDGRLVCAGAQARRPGQARGRLQQVAVDHRAREASWASSTWRPNRRCWPCGLRHRADRRAGVGHRNHLRPSATSSSPACW
jgi:prephenate dehydratase